MLSLLTDLYSIVVKIVYHRVYEVLLCGAQIFCVYVK